MAFPPHSFLFHSHEQNHHPIPPPTSLPSCPPPQLFHVPFMMKRSMSFSGIDHNKCEEDQMIGDDELSDDGSQIGEKKKRLNIEQVRALEKSFEVGNKLEPDRKMQLAKALGLQPRQIAIWFQNRRARWKTKQLEKDYGILKKQFEQLKADNDALHAQNNKLHAELMALKHKDSNEVNLMRRKENDQGSWSNGSTENSCDINLDMSTTPVITSPVSSQLSTKNVLFSSSILRPTSMTQLLQGSSRSDLGQFPKIDQMVQEENLCNMFNDEHQAAGFWPWPAEQQHFH